MAVLHDTEELKAVLSDLDFPAGKDEIVAHAERRGASREIVSALRAIPPAAYTEAGQVMRSVPVAEAPRQRSGSERAQQRREHGKPGLAEHMKDAEPGAIESEIGENRGS